MNLPPCEILDHCYEYVVREDIVLSLEEHDLSDKQCHALLKSSCPLADVFKEFEKQETEPVELLLPRHAKGNRIVTRYLMNRCIHPAILDYCFQNRILYESYPYHSAVFVGLNEHGLPKYANIRSTKGDFKGEAAGSDKHYFFHIPAQDSTQVHLFEAAIDLLSYATMEYMAGRDWHS